MTIHNPHNERIKRHYFTFLREARRQSEASVDAAAMAIARFETSTRYRDFKAFRIEQAVAFKRRLAEQNLSMATAYATLGHLKRFFVWLAGQPGYRSRLQYSDAEYFNQPENDARVATARRERPHPSLEQLRHVLANMPDRTELDQRNRALVAFTILTGARDTAIASMRLGHVDTAAGSVNQDARDVKTKNRKTFTTVFFPVGDDIRAIVENWVSFLREERLWSNHDPLFPATEIVAGPDRQFEAGGLKRAHWRTASPIRAVFKAAFEAAGLPYFHPHSIRKTLVELGEARCRTAEQFKAWSQNLGHEGVLTTFYSYGAVGPARQAEIINALVERRASDATSAEEIAAAVIRELGRRSN